MNANNERKGLSERMNERLVEGMNVWTVKRVAGTQKEGMEDLYSRVRQDKGWWRVD